MGIDVKTHRNLRIFLISVTLLGILWAQYGFDTDIWQSVPRKTNSSVKTILFWTTEWESKTNVWWGLDPYLGDFFFRQSPCQHKCVLSADKSMYKEADVLLFYFNDKPHWPAVKYPHQTYAHFVHEPPYTRSPINIKMYEGKINIKIHYRHDADIYYPYYKFVKKHNVTSDPYVPKVRLKDKPKSAAWAVSNCRAPSRRDDYVRELSKYIDVDIYGKCGSHTCERKNENYCMELFEQQYKFYLSFENNICKDYISEKAFHHLARDIIPVVLGGGDYKNDLPPHSVINVRDFESPKALAKYLQLLSNNETLYNSYFQWKKDFVHRSRLPMLRSLFCELCDGIHSGSLLKPASTHYNDWYYGKHDEVCDNNLVTRLLGRSKT